MSQRALVAAAVLTASLVVPLAAHAEPGPLAPYKYHLTAGEMYQDHPATGAEVFLLYYDQLDPSGRTSNVRGTAGSGWYAAAGTLLTYDRGDAHAVFAVDGSFEAPDTGGPEPFSGFVTVVYDRDHNVHSVAVDGRIGNRTFTVPPMPVIV